jgi:hypothetical protein
VNNIIQFIYDQKNAINVCNKIIKRQLKVFVLFVRKKTITPTNNFYTNAVMIVKKYIITNVNVANMLIQVTLYVTIVNQIVKLVESNYIEQIISIVIGVMMII